MNKTIGENMNKILSCSGLGVLFTHELDAMTYHEWRILPLTSWLPDEYGMLLFLYAHIFIFAVLMALVSSNEEKIRFRSSMAIGVFLLVHAMLHGLFTSSANYEFTSPASNILIYGGAVLGCLYLLLSFMKRNRIRA